MDRHFGDLILRLQGGLGNQLFQFAFGHRLAQISGRRLLIDLSFLKTYRAGITPRNFALEGIIPAGKLAVINQHSQEARFVIGDDTVRGCRSYEDVALLLEGLSAKEPINLVGFFQRETWIDETFLLEMHSHLVPEDDLSGASPFSPRVVIHVRRGDYATSRATRQFHGLLPLGYFYAAINAINPPAESISIVSDDTAWCQRHFRIGVPFSIENEASAGVHGEGHLRFLARHSALVISNSSFSWWGARLSEYLCPDAVIVAPAPDLWFRARPTRAHALVRKGWRLVSKRNAMIAGFSRPLHLGKQWLQRRLTTVAVR